MQLDDRATPTLELLEGSDGGIEGSLFQRLDATATAAGHRHLRAWLCR